MKYDKLINEINEYNDYKYGTYDIDIQGKYNKKYIYEKEKYRHELEKLIEEQIHRESLKTIVQPIGQTDDEKLDSIDIQVIEKYLRKKKLAALRKNESE